MSTGTIRTARAAVAFATAGFAVAVLLAACRLDETGTLTGTVCDGTSGLPVQGAAVSTEPATQTAITDAEGSFFIAAIGPGTYTVSVSAAGFSAYAGAVEIRPGVKTTIDVSLEAASVESSPPAYEARTWVATGGPFGGIGYDIRMRPDDPDIMYVTDDGAGAFKSTDGGMTWVTVNEGIDPAGTAGDNYSVFCLTIDPNNPDRVWIGSSGNSKLYRSDDGGGTWLLKNSGIVSAHETFRGFTVEPGNSDVVYAASEVPSIDWAGVETGGKVFDLTRGAVYKTIDGGEHWTRIWYGDHLCRYIWIDPGNHDRLFVSTGIFDREAANADPDGNDPGGVGVLRSDDGGQTWTVLNEANGFDSRDLYIGTLFMHLEDSDILLAGADAGAYNTNPDNAPGGLYRTDDGGDSWTRLVSGPINSVEICEDDPSVAYACSSLFYRSTDGGQTWSTTGEEWGPAGIVPGIPIDMQCDPRDANRIFVNGYGGGNFLSTDGGQTWVNASDGYTGARMAEVVVAASDASRICASGRPGIFSSSDGGSCWEGLSYGYAGGLEKGGITVDPSDALHLILCTDAAGKPVESFDGGKTWAQIDLDPESYGAGMVIPKIVVSPRDPATLFALTTSSFACWKGLEAFSCDADRPGSGLLISNDRGSTWSQTSITSGSVVSLAIPAAADAPLYASVCNKGIYRSTDGKTWQMVYDASAKRGAGQVYWRTIAIDPFDPEYLYAGNTLGGIEISNDGGVTWDDSSAGMPPEASVTFIAVDQVTAGVVYAATNNAGVYYATDSGRQWTALNDGLTITAVNRIALSSGGTVLYAATEGGGVFRLGTVPGAHP